MSNSPLIYEVEGLGFSYKLGSQMVEALHSVSLRVPEKSFLCLSGPSGSGKTTLLNILGLIEPVGKGSVKYSGKELGMLNESEKNRIRRFEIGFVFQNFHLIQVLNAFENIEYFLARQGLSKSERHKRVEEALQAVGLWEHRFKKPLEMSGGQRQRVALARAMAKIPKVIIADEPTASLDQKTGKEIMGIFALLNEKFGVTVIVSSHDPMVHSFVPHKLDLLDGAILHGTNEGGFLC